MQQVNRRLFFAAIIALPLAPRVSAPSDMMSDFMSKLWALIEDMNRKVIAKSMRVQLPDGTIHKYWVRSR
jgi:hypothetical protein